MKKQSLHTFLLIIISLFVLTSCATLSSKDIKNIQKVDKKIEEDFESSIENQDFFDACKNFIEYTKNFKDEKRFDMFNKVNLLYLKKREELEKSQNYLEALSYTYTMITLTNLIDGKEELKKYETYLKNKIEELMRSYDGSAGDLRKGSFYLFLSLFEPDNPSIYKNLVKIFLKRGNPFIADKYFRIYLEKLKDCEPENAEEIESIEKDIGKLKNEIESDKELLQNAIDKVVESSVKIIVDLGIKSSGGFGYPESVIGTGVVIDPEGYIITNYHVIEPVVDPEYEGYARVYITPGEDESVKLLAKVVGYDRVYDIALLKVEKKMVSNIKFGDSDTLRRGQKVYAIGNPVGLTNTVTSGIISSIDRPFIQIGSVIQIDVPINPGNSGGALIDEKGYVVGINFAGLPNYKGLNFALPINLIYSVLFKLYEEGEVERSWIGCTVSKSLEKLRVDYIMPESPASISGIMPGDYILEVAGRDVSEIFDAQRIVSLMPSPIAVSVLIERNGEEICKSILLDKRPEIPSAYIYQHDAEENIITPIFGIKVRRSEGLGKKTYIVEGVIPGSPAQEAGISEGDELKLRKVEYLSSQGVFILNMEIKSKRYGYLDKNLVLYADEIMNNFL